LAYAGHESSERTPVTSTLPGDQRPWTQISHVCVPERMNARVAAATPNGGYRVPRDRRAVTICNDPHVPGLPSQVPGEPVPADRSRRGAHHHVIVNIARDCGQAHSIGCIPT
jgi:hypothetical protein